MDFEWDEAKCAANISKHGVDFEDVYDFDWETAFIAEDSRRDYGEGRFRATGGIGGRLHVLVFTRRSKTRVISLRPANRREIQKYEEQHAEKKEDDSAD